MLEHAYDMESNIPMLACNADATNNRTAYVHCRVDFASHADQNIKLMMMQHTIHRIINALVFIPAKLHSHSTRIDCIVYHHSIPMG
jgi:hypothetical protein